MHTQLADFLKDTRPGKRAGEIIQNCVHCGFCNATCPTYRLLGDELDGPRGRIYQIKQLLEGEQATPVTRLHLDRCLTCRACETTCPSGVQYGELVDIGRELVEQQLARSGRQKLVRKLIGLLAHPVIARSLFLAARALSPVLPRSLSKRVLPRCGAPIPAGSKHHRTMVLLDGCVQPAAAPQINAAAIHVFDQLGIELIMARQAGCCGSLQHHLGDTEAAQKRAMNNVDAWWPLVEAGAEAIVISASGCAPLVKDYGQLLADHPAYAQKAARLACLACDLGEALAREDVSRLRVKANARIAFHSPCTLQHGQKLPGLVESLLEKIGFELTQVPDAHLCCGSAGAWSLLNPGMSGQLRAEKLQALQSQNPELIATANIGCLLHLHAGAEVPVLHWIELISRELVSRPS